MTLGWAAKLSRSVPESRMKRFLVAAALIFAAGPVWAADLPQPVPPPPPQAPSAYIPAPAPVYNWGGVYFGVNGGYGIGKSDWTPATGISTGNFNVSGYAFGPTVGANLQFDAFVVGIDGDFDGMGTDGTNSTCTPVKCETKNTWLGTVRGRVGYAVDRLLFYGTAGGAFGNIQANTSGTSFQHKVEPGWTAGAGLEVAFADNWTARAEYLFVDLENASFATVLSPSGTASTTTVKFYDNVIRLGLDYKFR